MQWHDWPPRDLRLLPAFEAWRQADFEAAREAFDRWTREHPSDADGWRGLGNVFWSLRAFEACLGCYQRAVGCDPWNPMHWGNLGLVFRDLGQLPAADAAFTICIALAPTYAPGLNEWANVHYDAGFHQAALALYARSLACDDSRAVVHHNRGVCLRTLGDAAGAVQSFRTALAIDPAYRHSLIELARLQD